MQLPAFPGALCTSLLATELTAQTAPPAAQMQLDSFGDRRAGQDPVDYSLHGQFEQFHADLLEKDENSDPDIGLRLRFAPNQSIGGEPGSFDTWGWDFEREAVISTGARL